MDTRTDFAAYAHPVLVQMLHASNPDAVTEAGDTWAAIGRSLHDRAGDLDQQLRRFDGMWQGNAADQYHTMISDLVDGIRQTATAALTIRDLTYQASEALQTAWRTMPPAMAVPTLDPSVLATAQTPVPATGLSVAAQAALRQLQAQATVLVQQQQQAAAVAGALQAQAAAVMTRLADQDVAIVAGMPATPAATVPAIAPDGTVLVSAGGVLNPAGQTGAPLFGRLFTAGLAAAGAASGGQFGTVPVRLTTPGTTTPTASAPTASAPGVSASGAAAAALGAAALAKAITPTKLGGIGGGGGIGTPAVPVASPSLAGTSAVTGLAGAAGTAAGAAAAQSQAAGGFMPAMPYGMAGAADGGASARRTPAWLVETEDVWGESATVTPGVIGEELPAVPDPMRRSWT
jgi:uncharacterized protein YukE